MDPDDLEWLQARLHKDNCRQCNLVRDLIASAKELVDK